MTDKRTDASHTPDALLKQAEDRWAASERQGFDALALFQQARRAGCAWRHEGRNAGGRHDSRS